MATLIFNGGSTGWKIAVYDVAADAVPIAPAIAELDLAWPPGGDPDDARITFRGATRSVRAARGLEGITAACAALRAGTVDLDGLDAVGHRIVHGGPHLADSVVVDDAVEDELRELEPLAPSHNAIERATIDAARELFPGVPQIAAFDTAFHRTLPEDAYTYAGPYAWRERGIRRYGFHGLSVAYCVERVAQLLECDVRSSGIVVAHLGGGCSVTAVRDGASADTSMGFTPLDGIMMGSRSGSVDPGILTYLARDDRSATASDFGRRMDDDLNHASGLAGISGVSADVRELERVATDGNARAELALAMFARRAAAAIAGAVTSLDRFDALVFTGGIGEHSAAIRARICERLSLLGIVLDSPANASRKDDGRIEAAGPAVFAIQTREEWYVARECSRVLGSSR